MNAAGLPGAGMPGLSTTGAAASTLHSASAGAGKFQADLQAVLGSLSSADDQAVSTETMGPAQHRNEPGKPAGAHGSFRKMKPGQSARNLTRGSRQDALAASETLGVRAGDPVSGNLLAAIEKAKQAIAPDGGNKAAQTNISIGAGPTATGTEVSLAGEMAAQQAAPPAMNTGSASMTAPAAGAANSELKTFEAQVEKAAPTSGSHEGAEQAQGWVSDDPVRELEEVQRAGVRGQAAESSERTNEVQPAQTSLRAEASADGIPATPAVLEEKLTSHHVGLSTTDPAATDGDLARKASIHASIQASDHAPIQAPTEASTILAPIHASSTGNDEASRLSAARMNSETQTTPPDAIVEARAMKSALRPASNLDRVSRAGAGVSGQANPAVTGWGPTLAGSAPSQSAPVNPALTVGDTAHPPAASGRESDTFTALDAAAPATTWIHAGARHAEAGYLDPALGWVGVRAETAGNVVHAAIVPGSAEAAQTLGSHLAGLNAYLAEHHGQAASLTLAPPESGTNGRSMDQPAADQQAMDQQAHGQRHDQPGYQPHDEASPNRSAGLAGTVTDRISPVEESPVNISGIASLDRTGGHISVMA